MKNRIFLIMALLLFAVLGLAACGTGADKSALEDTIWLLESYGAPGNLKAVLEDTEITVQFASAEGAVTGSAGCNSYGGSYEVNQGKLTLPEPLISTMMACPEPIMTQELEYLSLLQTAESYKIEDGQLSITCGQSILIFRRQ